VLSVAGFYAPLCGVHDREEDEMMKRSEYIRTLAGRCNRNPDNPTASDAKAATLAEEAGVKWDPEEPELPERLEISMGGSIGIPHPLGSAVAMSYVHREAAARYNAIERLAQWLGTDGSAWTGARGLAVVALQEKLEKVLDEERERLR
jgi:hypothetical protein